MGSCPEPVVWRAVECGVDLLIRVTPNARADSFNGVWRGADGEARLAIKVAAPPEGDRANAAVIALLAEALSLPRSRLKIRAGAKDRLKSVRIDCEVWMDVGEAIDALVAGPAKGDSR